MEHDDSAAKQQPIYLHGDLDLNIIEAGRLPNLDALSTHFRRCLTCGDRNLITSDVYVTVSVPQATLARTRVIKNAVNPHWDEHFSVPLAHPAVHIKFQVKDDDVLGAEVIGTVKIPAGKLVSGDLISGWFPLNGADGKHPDPDTAALRVEMKFTPCEDNPMYRHGIAGDPLQSGVRNTYFPVRKGNTVKLYQDAHVTSDRFSPEIELDGGKLYKHGTCWEDICHAILEAHHLIYVAGWSIFTKIKLVREPTRPLPRSGDLSLGDLLKYKSEEGVRVLMLVWDDKTSLNDKFGIKGLDLMKTHDEETRKFFKHSSVKCVLAPRYASSKLSFIKQKIVGTMFTHHQKCVLLDTQAYGNDRKITTFIGGLDLCDGRYDTPEHRLFRDLKTVFKDDFHNGTFADETKAPRQPWHDLHCKIDGPAAYDVLINFEQRWRRAIRWRDGFNMCSKEKYQWNDDALIKIDRISWILSPNLGVSSDSTTVVPEDDPLLWVSSEDDPENWHVQIFRSIDSGALKGFPTYVEEAAHQNLICSKDLVVDKSIQTAYIQAIRSAQRYIYIENQYFLGSSYAWPSYDNAGADQLIPMELALKIASKIRANERFAVYIIVPMWPEGDPKSDQMQDILFWQNQTMQMMYDVVAKELKSHELLNAHPQDYLNFYCLGKREKLLEENGQENGVSSASKKHQRFMIYVHAKGMIVDDEYIIVGSANINQRSMAGTKDTEIAMGAYQPHYTWARKKQHPHGQVYGYRMSLWAEHLGKVDKYFKEPESPECVKMVNDVAVDNWKRYIASEFTTLQGHLMRYPVQVDTDGKVGPVPGHEHFPDVGGKVVGARSIKLPDILTT